MTERETRPFSLFSEHERLNTTMTHKRFMALIERADVDIHEVKLDSNTFGEYLFITLSCRTDPTRTIYTFWGMGYHDYRERWITDSWGWYEASRKHHSLAVLNKRKATQHIRDHEAQIRANATPEEQSEQAKLYELLADLTDEDGALTELQDLGWLFFGDDDIAEDGD